MESERLARERLMMLPAFSLGKKDEPKKYKNRNKMTAAESLRMSDDDHSFTRKLNAYNMSNGTIDEYHRIYRELSELEAYEFYAIKLAVKNDG